MLRYSLTLTHLLPQNQWKKHETRFADKEWTVEETAAFEDAIHVHGPELRAVRDAVVTRSMPEVVRYYPHWKKSSVFLFLPCSCCLTAIHSTAASSAS